MSFMGDRSSSKAPIEHLLKVLNQLKEGPTELQDGEDAIILCCALHLSHSAQLPCRVLLSTRQANTRESFFSVDREGLADDDGLSGDLLPQRTAAALSDEVLLPQPGQHRAQCCELCQAGFTQVNRLLSCQLEPTP